MVQPSEIARLRPHQLLDASAIADALMKRGF